MLTRRPLARGRLAAKDLTWIARVLVLAAAWVCAGPVAAGPQAPPDIDSLMTKIGDRVAEYYRRARSVVCLEQSIVQPIQSNWAPDGFSRTVESELRVESEAADGDTLPKTRVVRDIRRVNGRAAREKDKKDRAGCTDPNPVSPEPLAFLLPAHRDDYRFASPRAASENDRAALIIDFTTTNRISRPELVEDERGHDDCFDWWGPLATRGRLWVDATTHDVLRIERRIAGPVDVRVPERLQRRYNLAPQLVLERDDQTIRFKAVTFRDPHEVMLLPESIESLTMVRSGLQSTRRVERFSSYRRFLTTGRIVQEP
jgi:hypothetical protein